MQNKKGNIAVIAIIIIIVAVTASVITWIVAKKTQRTQKEVRIQSIPTNQVKSNDNIVSWKDYSSQKFGLSIKVPEKVLLDYNDKSSWSKLNIFEDDKGIIFTTQSSLEEALEMRSWDLRIGISTISSKDEDKIVSFLESFYEVKGCKVQFNKDKGSDLFNVLIYGDGEKNVTKSLDDPYACPFGGKMTTTYDEISGKLITYNTFQSFFLIPGDDPMNNVADESLKSIKFIP